MDYSGPRKWSALSPLIAFDTDLDKSRRLAGSCETGCHRAAIERRRRGCWRKNPPKETAEAAAAEEVAAG